MNIDFRDSNGKLHSRDILDVDLNMEVVELVSGKYVIKLNASDTYDAEYDTLEEAEWQLKYISNVRNRLESELHNEG